MDRVIHSTYRVINKPLTICGADRRLFFLAVTVGAAVWIALETVIGGLVVIGGSVYFARLVTQKDPEMLRLIFNAAKYRSIYDPSKREREAFLVVLVRKGRHA
jgi:type IV secretory pathway TrbD component